MRRTLQFIAAFLLLQAVGFAQAAYNYVFYNVNAGVSFLDPNWFGDRTLGSDAFFLHTAGGPIQATVGLGLKRVGSDIEIDFTQLSLVALTGDYNDLTNKPTIPSAPAAPSYNFAVSAKTIQTVAAAANGFQVSSSRNSWVTYSVTITTATTLLATTNSSGYVVLEIAATNSTTASDWKEVGRVPSGQNNALTVAVGSLTQTGGGSLSGMVPSGYYTRLRSVIVADTPTFAYNSGQEVLL